MVDIVEIKTLVNKGRLKVILQYGNIILIDTQTDESVKIGELQIK